MYRIRSELPVGQNIFHDRLGDRTEQIDGIAYRTKPDKNRMRDMELVVKSAKNAIPA